MLTYKIKLTDSLLVLLVCLAAAPASASEQINKEKTVTVVSYGIYAHTTDNGKNWINPISDKTIKSTTSSPVHLNSTRIIPARHPLFFGFVYNIENLNGQTAEITTEVTHPKIKQADGSFLTQYKETNKFLILDGKITATNGYLLENNNETQTGEWIFKIKLQGETIITQNFQVKK